MRILPHETRCHPAAHHPERGLAVVRDAHLHPKSEIEGAVPAVRLRHPLANPAQVAIEHARVQRVRDEDAVRDPARELRDLRPMGGEVDGNVRAHRLEGEARVRERDDLSLQGHGLAAQQRAHDLHRLAQRRHRQPALDTELAEALAADPEAEHRTPAAQLVEGGDGGGGHRRMPRVRVRDARSEQQPAGMRGDRREPYIALPPETDIGVPERPIAEVLAQSGEPDQLLQRVVGEQEEPERRSHPRDRPNRPAPIS